MNEEEKKLKKISIANLLCNFIDTSSDNLKLRRIIYMNKNYVVIVQLRPENFDYFDKHSIKSISKY